MKGWTYTETDVWHLAGAVWTDRASCPLLTIADFHPLPLLVLPEPTVLNFSIIYETVIVCACVRVCSCTLDVSTEIYRIKTDKTVFSSGHAGTAEIFSWRNSIWPPKTGNKPLILTHCCDFIPNTVEIKKQHFHLGFLNFCNY